MRRVSLGTMALLAVSACSNEQIYDTVQHNRALECQKYPDTRYEECMATIDTDYKDYERELDDGTQSP